MSNDIAKALKQKTDAMLRLQGQSQKPVVYENIDGSYTAPEKSDYTAVLAAGKNVQILVSGNVKTIHAVMGILAGDNIKVSAPDPITGEVTITGTISGKGINITEFAGKDGYSIVYDEVNDKFILSEITGGGSITQATETVLGGIKAKVKTTETSEVVIDPATGKLYTKAPDAATNGLPQGGAAGQIPAKVDETDYNIAWINPPTGGGGQLPTGLMRYRGIWTASPYEEKIITFENGLFSADWTFDKAPFVINDLDVVTGTTKALSLSDINGLQSTFLEFVINWGAGTMEQMKIRYHLQSESGYDFFRILVDNVQVFSDSGNNAVFKEKLLTLTNGLHTIRFLFSKDGGGDIGFDNVRLGQIKYYAPPAVPDNYMKGNVVLYESLLYMSIEDNNSGVPNAGAGWRAI